MLGLAFVFLSVDEVVGMHELMNTLMEENPWTVVGFAVEHFTDAEVNSLHYNMWTALEEGMEMSGVIVLIYAVLDFMQGNGAAAVTVEVREGGR